MTPEEVFAKHELNAADAMGAICVGCYEAFPCDAFLLACHTEEQREITAQIIADLVAQRDACLDEMNRR